MLFGALLLLAVTKHPHQDAPEQAVCVVHMKHAHESIATACITPNWKGAPCHGMSWSAMEAGATRTTARAIARELERLHDTYSYSTIVHGYCIVKVMAICIGA